MRSKCLRLLRNVIIVDSKLMNNLHEIFSHFREVINNNSDLNLNYKD